MMKEAIKSVLRKCPLTKHAFTQWEEKKIALLIENKRIKLHKIGYTIIQQIQESLEKTDELFFFDFGTLLGIVREGAIIGHDLDIDVGVVVKDQLTIKKMRNALAEDGFDLHATSVLENDCIVQDTFFKDSINFDMSYYYEFNDAAETYLLYRDPNIEYDKETWSVVKAISDKITSTIDYSFRGFMVSVPENYESHLANRYGPSWRIPDKNYIYWMGPGVQKIDTIGKMIIYDKEKKNI